MSFNFFSTPSSQEIEAAAQYAAQAAYLSFQIPDISANRHLRKIQSAAVIGAGTMGGGIAMSLANIGIAVHLIDTDKASLDRGISKIQDNYSVSVKRGKLTTQQFQDRMALILPTLDWQAAAGADLFIEAVFEDIQLKKDLFSKIDALAKQGAILATNTSGLDVNAIGDATKRPQDVVGAHFFSPAHVMRLLEVVRSDATSPDVITTLMDLGRRMGKTAVLSRVYPGFIGNAMFRHYTREAHFLIEDGALPHEVDGVLTRFGYAMGVLAVQDMAGNDVGYQTKKAMIESRATDRRWSDLTLTLTDMGRRGQKDGKGWYRYDDGDRKPQRDPEFESWIVGESARLGRERKHFTPEEILKRCLYGMINEGARLLEAGIALRASDIDTVCLTGYGFPKEQGGPLYLADKIGLKSVLADIERFHDEMGFWWTPAPLLRQLVHEGKSFMQWDAEHACSHVTKPTGG
ncbi:3-hydroxyacyl-CoA dehydrogenase [Limnohabitans sp. Hippo4]|uniref:3-hydroxyacyl-CoA dehydrogenase n=1 Tax=Limnohabitans sp. Hippo4 TaxID=1826167 RepID=UPI000D3925B7|nr:3-hydroxyacyl-CoA dehydrogenase [Limnohabitans sp. Hippo4]PUE36769.1 3-hydroxyacyl-CoA dehydrogenase [Limnohabitans sp. Hippo4]